MKPLRLIKPLIFLLVITPILVLFKFLIQLLGLVLVPIGLIKAKTIDPAPEHPTRKVDDPWQYIQLEPKWIDDIWGSRKYGAQGNYFWNDDQDTTKFWPRFKWLALRNSASNMEVKFPIYRVKPDPETVVGIGTPRVGDVRGIAGFYFKWVPNEFMAEVHYIKQWTDNRCLRFRWGYKGLDTGSAKLSFNFSPYASFGRKDK